MRALRYSFEEAFVSLWRGRRSGILSMATISLALFVLGGFLVVTSNLERLGTEWSTAAEMSVYIRDEATPEQRQSVERALAPGDVVASRDLVSKADALGRFKETFADLAAAIDTLGENPLPGSYEVHLRPGAASTEGVDRLAERVRVMPGVLDVRYDRQWLSRLLTAIGLIRGFGLVLGAIMTIAAALTVANVVRLALHARRDE